MCTMCCKVYDKGGCGGGGCGTGGGGGVYVCGSGVVSIRRITKTNTTNTTTKHTLN